MNTRFKPTTEIEEALFSTELPPRTVTLTQPLGPNDKLLFIQPGEPQPPDHAVLLLPGPEPQDKGDLITLASLGPIDPNVYRIHRITATQRTIPRGTELLVLGQCPHGSAPR